MSQQHPDPNLEQRLQQLEQENAQLRIRLRELTRSTPPYPEVLAEREHELGLLKEVSHAIVTELDLQRVLNLVVQKAREIICAETVLIPMIDESRDRYEYVAAAGKNASDILGTRFPLHVGMCGWVLTREQPLLYGAGTPFAMDASTTWEEGQTSALLVPLIGRNKIIGGISALGKQGGGSFTQRDLDLISLFANQVSIAIENASLFKALRDSRDNLEQRVEERTMELSTINRALETFCYSASHDLRTPLRSIDGFSFLLQEDYGEHLDEIAQDYLNRIRSCSQRMGNTIDDILSLSNITRHRLHPEPADLEDLARGIATRLQCSEPARQVHWEIQPGMHVVADRLLLRTLLTHLLENAWKFTRPREQARIGVSMRETDGRQVFCVEDNGIGFDTRYQDKLFKPFQKLHDQDNHEGNGVGLALAARIADRHGGEIWAESSEDGAAFYFTLAP